MKDSTKLTTDFFDEYIEQQIALYKNRTLKIRTYILRGDVKYIVKTKRGTFVCHNIVKAINVFNDPDN